MSCEASSHRGADELGRGAHAVVLRRKNACGRDVAVKYFRKEMPALEDFSFATKLLVHPHVVQLFTLNATEGWLSMEAVDGFSLDVVLLRTGPLQEQQIVAVLADVTAGLAVFHAHGVPHRDVKPGNIMQDSRTAQCKLIDWIGQHQESCSLRMGMPEPSLAGQWLHDAGGDGAWAARTGSGPMLMRGDIFAASRGGGAGC